MKDQFFYILRFADPSTAAVGNDGLTWFEALPAKTWTTGAYGKVPVTLDKLQRFVQNFKSNVRGIDIALDYNHGQDAAKGSKASGWIRDMAVRDNSLHLGVEFTDTARAEIQNGEWKYFSLEWADNYIHSDGGTKHQDVVLGGGLTNRPVAKGVVPINFSEFYSESESVDNDPNEGGEKLMTEAEKRLRRAFGLSETATDAEVDAAITSFAERNTKFGELETQVTTLTDELAPLRELKNTIENKRKFAEDYPDEHASMMQMQETNRKLTAKTFSEQYKSVRFSDVKITKADDGSGNDVKVVTPTTRGLSGLAIQKLEDTAVKFAEGTATLDDYKETVDAIMLGGIVDYGTTGSETGLELNDDSITITGSTLANRTLFAEKVAEVQTKDKLDQDAAIAVVAKAHPELFAAWRNPIVTA